MIFSRFLTKNFQTRSPAERKNDFHIKILLETCSATSNYPWNWLSCHQDMYCGLYMKKFFKIEQIRHFSALFGGVFMQFLHKRECQKKELKPLKPLNSQQSKFFSHETQEKRIAWNKGKVQPRTSGSQRLRVCRKTEKIRHPSTHRPQVSVVGNSRKNIFRDYMILG